MEELTKTQLVLLVLLVSFMTSVVTGIVTVTLIDQAPKPVTQTINRVVEKIVGTGEGSKNNNDPFVVNEKTVVVTQEEKITFGDSSQEKSTDENTITLVKTFTVSAINANYNITGFTINDQNSFSKNDFVCC